MIKKTCNPKIVKKIEITGVLLSLIIVATIIYGITNINSIENLVTGNVYYYGILGIIFSAMILDLFPQIVSPFVVLAATIVAGLNIPLAIFLVVLGSTIGATIGFFLGKKYMFVLVGCLVNQKKVEKMTLMMNKYGRWAISLTAMSPFPYLPIVFGMLNLSKRNFIIYGLIPRAIGLTLFGYLISFL